MEEIVGEIQDEHEAEEPPDILQLSAGCYEFDGMVLLDDIADMLPLSFGDPEEDTIGGYVYDMLYGNSGGYPSYASAAAIILFTIVLTITCINLLVSKKHVYY